MMIHFSSLRNVPQFWYQVLQEISAQLQQTRPYHFYFLIHFCLRQERRGQLFWWAFHQHQIQLGLFHHKIYRDSHYLFEIHKANSRMKIKLTKFSLFDITCALHLNYDNRNVIVTVSHYHIFLYVCPAEMIWPTLFLSNGVMFRDCEPVTRCSCVVMGNQYKYCMVTR